MLKKLKRYWKKILAILAVVAVVAGGFVDIKQVIVESWAAVFPKPQITLSYTAKGDVHAGDTIILSYQTPDTGYLSLWNVDAANDAADILLPLQGMQALALNPKIQQASLNLKARSGSGTDQFVLLWTDNDKPTHLPHRHYASRVEFDAALKTLQAKGGVLVKRIDVPVF